MLLLHLSVHLNMVTF